MRLTSFILILLLKYKSNSSFQTINKRKRLYILLLLIFTRISFIIPFINTIPVLIYNL